MAGRVLATPCWASALVCVLRLADALPRSSSATTACWAVRRVVSKVACCFAAARAYRALLAGLLWCVRNSVVVPLWPRAAGWRPTTEDCLQCSVTASFGTGVRAVRCRRVSGVLSAPCPTRLETRTKESNMCASQRALRNPRAK